MGKEHVLGTGEAPRGARSAEGPEGPTHGTEPEGAEGPRARGPGEGPEGPRSRGAEEPRGRGGGEARRGREGPRGRWPLRHRESHAPGRHGGIPLGRQPPGPWNSTHRRDVSIPGERSFSPVPGCFPPTARAVAFQVEVHLEIHAPDGWGFLCATWNSTPPTACPRAWAWISMPRRVGFHVDPHGRGPRTWSHVASRSESE